MCSAAAAREGGKYYYYSWNGGRAEAYLGVSIDLVDMCGLMCLDLGVSIDLVDIILPWKHPNMPGSVSTGNVPVVRQWNSV